MSSLSTVLTAPVLRSSSAPRGTFARCSVTMHRTRNRAPYAPLWDSTPEAPSSTIRPTVPAITNTAQSAITAGVQAPDSTASISRYSPR